MKFWRVVSAALLVSALAGCGMMGTSKEVPPPCPKVRLLGDANKLTQFRQGTGRDATDVAFQVDVVGLDAVCEFKDKNANVVVTTTLGVAATRGPASQGDVVSTISYFVAVVDSTQQILVREAFESRIDLPAGRRRAGVVEETVQRIPLNGKRSSEIEILVGLQLSEEQLQFNRQQRGTP